jgi:hypothetical protein
MSAELDFLNKMKKLLEEYIEHVQSGTSSNAGYLVSSTSEAKPQTFRFQVDSHGKFTYDPPDSWGYNSDSPIRVESNKEFTILATPMPGNLLNVNPWGDLHRAQRSNGGWFVEVNPQGAAYAVSAGVRDKVYQEQGYLAKYNLEIEVPSNGGSYKAIKNGVYHC